ncbi:MAG: ROK family protein [Proteobacteria bacterium]|nr:ROK family protein [Pseudomonadota bacterium]
MADHPLVGGIELGGTKIVLAVGHRDGTIVARTAIPTEAPQQSLPQLIAFFAAWRGRLCGLGVAAFGPIVIDPAAAGYGHLLATNKPGWSGFDLVGSLARALGLPIRLVTDVGAAGIAEARLGALRGAPLGIYLTVGTGIGGAILIDGDIAPALLHPELGHLPLQRHPDDGFASTCRFHDCCAEGLAAGPAIQARFGSALNAFREGSDEHRLICDYLGQLCAHLTLALSPHRIVIGGGVAQAPGMIPETLRAMVRHLGGYATPHTPLDDYLRSPTFGQDAGIAGALLCAPG